MALKNFFKLKKILLCAVLLFFGAMLVIFPQRYLAACFDGLCLWAECVLPSLFPFMVITMLLIKLGAAQAASKPFKKISARLKLPAAAFPLFFMSVFSGYPAGSRLVCEYCEQGVITENDAKKLAPLCSVCGPLFALGTVGVKAFGGNGAGIKLFCACLISVVSTSLIYCLLSKRPTEVQPQISLPESDGDALFSSFYGGVTAVTVAGGFICFFYTLSKVFADFNILKPLEFAFAPLFGQAVAAGLCSGFCEATGGCFAVASAGGFFALPAAGFLITFGGASILMQQLCYLNKCGVKSGYFIGFKFLQGVLCFALLCLFNLF